MMKDNRISDKDAVEGARVRLMRWVKRGVRETGAEDLRGLFRMLGVSEDCLDDITSDFVSILARTAPEKEDELRLEVLR